MLMRGGTRKPFARPGVVECAFARPSLARHSLMRQGLRLSWLLPPGQAWPGQAGVKAGGGETGRTVRRALCTVLWGVWALAEDFARALALGPSLPEYYAVVLFPMVSAPGCYAAVLFPMVSVPRDVREYFSRPRRSRRVLFEYFSSTFPKEVGLARVLWEERAMAEYFARVLVPSPPLPEYYAVVLFPRASVPRVLFPKNLGLREYFVSKARWPRVLFPKKMGLREYFFE